MADRSRNASSSLFVVVLAIIFLGLWYLLSHMYGNALADQITELVGQWFGIPTSQITALIATYVLPGGGAALFIWAAYAASRWHLLQTEFAEDPRANALTLTPMNVTEIAEYLLNKSAWGWHNRLRLTVRRFVRDQVPREMRRAGMAREVRFIGAMPNSINAVEIEPNYWRFATVDDGRVWDSRNSFFTTELSGNSPSVRLVHYQFGKAPQADVMRTWPRASLVLRTWITIRLRARRARPGFPKSLREDD